MPPYYPDANIVSTSSQQQPAAAPPRPGPAATANVIVYQRFNPDDMELDVSSAPSSRAPSHPDTPISRSWSDCPSPRPTIATHSAMPCQLVSPTALHTTVLPLRGAHHHSHYHPHHRRRSVPEDACNAYAGYTDHWSLLPGAAPNASLFMQQGMALAPLNGSGSQNGQSGNGAQVVCAPIAMILSGSAGNTPNLTPTSSRITPPIPGDYGACQNVQASSSGAGWSSGSVSSSNVQASGSRLAAQTARASTTLSRPASSLLRQSCNRTNGVNHTTTHGSCNLALHKDLEHLQELLASKHLGKAAAAGEGEVTLCDATMREVENDAERRLGPYVCGVGGCRSRYKTINGICRHYQSSGDHGAIGLALLASGQYYLEHNESRHATPSPSNSNSAPSTPQTHSRAASQHSSLSLNHQQPQQSQPQPPTYQSALANPPAYSRQPQYYATQHYKPQTQ